MAKPSNEKQPSKHHRQSRLRHVEQVPDSDTVIPDTQVEAAHRDHGVGLDDEPVDQADLAFLEHNAFKRPADTTAPSQPFGFKPLNPPFGIEKPSSATTNGPTFSFCQIRRAANKTPPKEETQVLQLSVLPDTAVLSIEQADNEASGQGTGACISSKLELRTLQLSMTPLQSRPPMNHLRLNSVFRMICQSGMQPKLTTISLSHHHA